jgi:GH35 family endo-1,4-beta-xylanase
MKSEQILHAVKRLLFISVVSGVLGCTVSSSTAQHKRFGIRGILGTQDTAKAVKAARGCGVSWARIVVFWDKVEPVQGQFAWQEADSVIGELLRNGVNVLVTIRSYSQWASRKSKVVRGKRKTWKKYKVSGLPLKEHTVSYQRFVQKLVERYDGDDDFAGVAPSPDVKKAITQTPVKYWQIENEPGGCDVAKGSHFWNGTAEELATLTMLASDAIKRADGGAKIVLAGFGFNAMRKCSAGGYPERMIQILKSNKYQFDVFDIHNYRDLRTIYRQVADVKRLLETYGFAEAKIWMTETDFNWRKLKLGISQKTYTEHRAESLIKKYVGAFRLGVEKIFQWKLTDSKGAKWPPAKKAEFTKFRGIFDENVDRKPITSIYQLMISKLDGFSKVDDISKGSVRAFRFSVQGSPVIVAWSERGAATFSVEMKKVQITNVSGHETFGNGQSITLPTAPVFIEEPALQK